MTKGLRSKPFQKTLSGSLTDQAYRRLEELIITLELPPGTVLSEQRLSEQLGIGRTPIREALQRLAVEGLVLILPRRGVLVSDINPRTQLRMLELRREVQRLLARLAAERSNDEERAGFASITEQLIRAANTVDEKAFVRLDRELDLLMWQAARNEFAVRSMSLMTGLSRRFWFQHYKEAADLPLAARLHADMSDGIAKGSGRLAALASDRLIDYIESFTRETVRS